MLIALSKRLQAIAATCPRGEVFIDIGTDHAYLPVYLVQKETVRRAVACDVKKGPLNIAAKNIEKYGLEQQIETRLSDGFQNILAGEGDIATIAGMGGMLIADILKKGASVLAAMDCILLQPQQDIEEVRRTVHQIGFQITDEEMVEEGQHFYFILQCKKGREQYEDPLEYQYGKKLIEKKSSILKKYMETKLVQTTKIIAELALQKTDMSEKRLGELKEKQGNLEEGLKWL